MTNRVRVPRAEFRTLFDRFEHTAWRLECQGVYHEPDEQEPLRRFLAGQEPDHAWLEDWLDWIRTLRAGNRKLGRVRVLTEPLTDYLRFELSITPPAIEAGEDIRVLPEAEFAALDIPTEDFWIFDDATVGILEFGPAGFETAQIITDPGEVSVYRDRQQRAWDAAVPYH